jgi:hypothetical protein
MRKHLTVLGALLLILISASTSAVGETGIAIGPKFGLNFAMMTGDLVDTLVAGVEADASSVVRGMFGIFATIELSDYWAIRPELLYCQTAGEWKWISRSGIATSTITELIEIEYVEIPILAKFTIPQSGRFQPFFYGGPAVAFHAASSFKFTAVADTSGVTVLYDDSYDDHIYNAKSTVWEVIFGGGIEWKLGEHRLILEGRYRRNITPLFEDVGDFNAVPKDDAAVARYPSGEAFKLNNSIFSVVLAFAFTIR